MDTELRRWFFLEENLFISQIIVGMIFLALSYIYQSRSIWNKNKPKYRRFSEDKVVLDIWNLKNNSDFLHHLKFEFMQSTFFGSYFYVCMVLLSDWSFWNGVDGLDFVESSIVCLAFAHFF